MTRWDRVGEGRYALTDGRYWAQFLDYSPGECWALWQAQEEPPATKRSGRVVCFCDTLGECVVIVERRLAEVGLSASRVIIDQ